MGPDLLTWTTLPGSTTSAVTGSVDLKGPPSLGLMGWKGSPSLGLVDWEGFFARDSMNFWTVSSFFSGSGLKASLISPEPLAAGSVALPAGAVLSSSKKRRRRKPEKCDHLGDMCSTPIGMELWLMGGKKVPTLEDIPHLHGTKVNRAFL